MSFDAAALQRGRCRHCCTAAPLLPLLLLPPPLLLALLRIGNLIIKINCARIVSLKIGHGAIVENIVFNLYVEFKDDRF